MKAKREDDGTVGDVDVAAVDDEEEEKEENKADLGFEDPFFTAPEEDKAATTAARKEAKRLKRAERAAAEAVASAQRAELELLVAEDSGKPGTRSIAHFDMHEIERAEKTLKKKKRKGKLSAREKAALEAKERDSFHMDVQDPRFGAVFERPEFAVDPSHPKFKGTEGMKALLEEGRRKRKGLHGEGDEAVERREKKRPRNEDGREMGKDEDVKKLVERVKNKTVRLKA